ncbi:MAG TPA: pantothenate kinase, partial [Gemmatimonadales bacterium]|nr:pantothenate kinase [Gemmatimonadales bacterium]
VDGIVERIAREWPGGKRPKVVATGGLAALVAPLCRTIEVTTPDLTLHGLRIAARHLRVGA